MFKHCLNQISCNKKGFTYSSALLFLATSMNGLTPRLTLPPCRTLSTKSSKQSMINYCQTEHICLQISFCAAMHYC